MDLKLVTSNLQKLEEFKRLLGNKDLQAFQGKDLREVASDDPVEVAKYKCIEAGVGSVVEDTVLEINGDVVTDIRYRLSELESRLAPAQLSWMTTLAVNLGDTIKVYQGCIEGEFKCCHSVPENAFGFDPYFVPFGSEKTLHELSESGQKDTYSARKVAINFLLADMPKETISIDSIPEWDGDWQ
ncbi:non-canonical purine NTP pyrophosphatase [Vibrio crassostreae]|uniref:non-canonical purine NTP pyrophosphatase n=1 Tax=Vibrio crassostreae TaxID=246167 RepID=UPI001B306775|nr:non-canonical purine NTP pyrophosphatase [Vibrio crassostreae]